MTKKATPAKKGKAAKAEKAPKAAKVEAASEHKASEVIPAVPVALLEAHPSLPQAEAWLAHFAEHYTSTGERHRVLEAQMAKPVPAPEPEPAKPAGKKQRSPLMPPTLPGAARPVAAPMPDLAWRAPAAPEPAPAPEPMPEPEAAAEAEVYAEAESYDAFAAPEPSAAPEPEAEFDLFAQLAAEEQRIEDPDDFLSRLTAQGEAAADGRSFEFEESSFTGASEPSSPFLATAEEGTTMIAAISEPEEEGTTMIAAISEPDEEPALAEPSDSTTMIAAISDEDLENLTAPSDEGAAAKGARKSRKASKKKKG